MVLYLNIYLSVRRCSAWFYNPTRYKLFCNLLYFVTTCCGVSGTIPDTYVVKVSSKTRIQKQNTCTCKLHHSFIIIVNFHEWERNREKEDLKKIQTEDRQKYSERAREDTFSYLYNHEYAKRLNRIYSDCKNSKPFYTLYKSYKHA